MKHFLPLRKHSFIFLLLACVSFSSLAQDVVVAKDGSGNFTTVQAAINAAPGGRTTPYVIYIKNGKYKEKINVPANKPFLQLVGESVANVILTYDDYSGKPNPAGGTFGTANSASVIVAANDFSAINITFENTTGDAPQALAINVTGDRAAFKNCRFLGGQDTVFAGGNGARQYFRNCYIDGTVDFIFGDARAVFDSCIIYAKTRIAGGNSYITAANTKQTEPFGYVFRNCKIPANRGGSIYVLGRPWQNDASTSEAAKSYNKTIFLNTTMSSSIQAVGWSVWDAGTDVAKITYAEYRSRKFDGTLVDVSQRVSWSQQLTINQAALYYDNSALFGTWDPCAVATGFCTNNAPEIAVSNFRGVKGTSTSNFTWNISWPIAGVRYEVLRSSDRTNFTAINEQTSTNDSTVNYSFAETLPPPGMTYYYLIRASKAGLNTHISDTVAISSTPTINVTGTFGSFIQGVGTPSTSQTYTVSAASLTNNLIITAPAGYELSTNGSTWNTSANPVVLNRDANGNIANTSISVRLNAASAGTYSGNITHASLGADTVRLAVTGTVQSSPLTVSEILQWWPMTVNNLDSAAVRSPGLIAIAPTLNRLVLSNGTTVPAVPAYSPTHGQAFAVTADGLWTTGAGGPGGNLARTYYEQFVIKASPTHSLRIDSLILTSSFYNTSSNTKLAVVYSKTGFAADSTNVTGGVGADGTQMPATANGAFATPVLLNNETAGNTSTYRFALAGGTGVTLASGDSLLTIRLYYACGSGSNGRYAKLKNVQVKGLATANPVAGDFRSHQSGEWSDVNTWEMYNGTAWVYPATAYPHYSNAGQTTILNGHTVTLANSINNGGGFIRRTKINIGGQLIVNNGAILAVASDGIPSTVDLQVDGTLTLLGGISTGGNVSTVINGRFVNSGTSLNFNAISDSVHIGPSATYQHNVNNPVTPSIMIWQPGSTFLVTGIATSQTGIFKSTIKYSNIVWNNPGQTNYYAFRTTLDSSNVQGSFTVVSTGSTNITFANTSGRLVLPGGYYQTGGTVNFRESGNVTDTLVVGGDFSVTGGTFNSNAGTGSSLLIRLNGVNRSLTYSQSTATNTNWEVNGVYNLGANLNLPSTGYGVTVNGTLNLGTYTISGAGSFTTMLGGIVTSGSPAGLNGNLTNTGTKTLNPAASYLFNGTAAQVTGSLFPANVNTLTVNNAAGVTLSGNVNVATSLTLSSGKLILGDNSIRTSSVIGTSSTNYVVTNGAGMLSLRNIGAGSNVFAVGPSATSYNPVTINNAGTSDTFSVSVKNTFDFPVPDANKVVNRQWTVNEAIPGGSNVTLSLSWTTADQAPGFNPANPVSIMRHNGNNWVYTTATITGAGTVASPYVATASGFTAFSPFGVINSDAVLPVRLLSFNAGYDNDQVSIWWSSANELNTASFEVERSTDGQIFSSIGSVTAKATPGSNNYSFADPDPLSGIVYYRLKMVDKDGTFTYSNVSVINSRLKGKLSIYPNPASTLLSLIHSRANAQAIAEVLTIDGKRMLVQKLMANTTRTSIDVSALAAGAYILKISNGPENTAIKFFKQ